MHSERTYRNLIRARGLTSFHVVVKETDLWVQAEKNLASLTKELVLSYRSQIESYISAHPEFLTTRKPWRVKGPAPGIISDMAEAGQMAGVGPMAAVAGAIAERVGMDLLEHSNQVVVENGGDVFFKLDRPVVFSIYAGNSPLSLKFGIQINSLGIPMGVCTSSGTIGHSYSMGKADAACVISNSCPLSDAAATAVGNRVVSRTSVQRAIDFGKTLSGVTGIVVIIHEAMGIWGDIALVPLTN